MKYNELIRPAGVGRKQVAFNTDYTPSPLFEAEKALNDAENANPYIDASVSVSGLSEAAAYSAATATQKEVENFVFEMSAIESFTWVPTAGVPEVRIPFAGVNILCPFITYDRRVNRFTLRKAGWYMVRVWFWYNGSNGNYDWWLSFAPESVNVTWNTLENYPRYMDYRNVYKHPSLHGTAFVNVPSQSVQGGQGEKRFGVNLGTTFTGPHTHTISNTLIGLQIQYLGALPMSERVIYEVGV